MLGAPTQERYTGESGVDSGSQLSRGPRCLAIAQEGINDGSSFTRFMSALMTDLVDGSINAGVGNAAVNAGGKLLKCVEMQLKYGSTTARDVPNIPLVARQ